MLRQTATRACAAATANALRTAHPTAAAAARASTVQAGGPSVAAASRAADSLSLRNPLGARHLSLLPTHPFIQGTIARANAFKALKDLNAGDLIELKLNLELSLKDIQQASTLQADNLFLLYTFFNLRRELDAFEFVHAELTSIVAARHTTSVSTILASIPALKAFLEESAKGLSYVESTLERLSPKDSNDDTQLSTPQLEAQNAQFNIKSEEIESFKVALGAEVKDIQDNILPKPNIPWDVKLNAQFYVHQATLLKNRLDQAFKNYSADPSTENFIQLKLALEPFHGSDIYIINAEYFKKPPFEAQAHQIKASLKPQFFTC